MLTFVGAVMVIAALGAEPVASPSPPPFALPEIGRVRANTPACTAMRDLVIPSFTAARRGDIRFEETRKRLPAYGEVVADAKGDDILVRSALARLDADATAMLNESLVINRALGDPRLADTKDPAIAEERRQLQQLYDAQQSRATILWVAAMIRTSENAAAASFLPIAQRCM